jgi:FkbM family methyltransferase
MGRWQWETFQGSPVMLRLMRRDIHYVDEAVKYCRGREACVQAGGNLGLYPKRLAKLFTTVYTFEPAADLWPMLLHNAPEPNIVKFQAAVGDERKLVKVSRARRDGKRHSHEGIGYTVPDGTVPTLRIDDLNLPVCDLVYLDIEGGELPALRGAVETLARCRPVVTVEINKSLGFVGLKPADVIGFLDGQGYRHEQTMGSDQIFLPKEWA